MFTFAGGAGRVRQLLIEMGNVDSRLSSSFLTPNLASCFLGDVPHY